MLERRCHLGEKSRVPEALADHQMAEPQTRVEGRQVGQERPALEERAVTLLEVVLDPDGGELGRECLEDVSVLAEPVTAGGVARKTLQPEVSHGRSYYRRPSFREAGCSDVHSAT